MTRHEAHRLLAALAVAAMLALCCVLAWAEEGPAAPAATAEPAANAGPLLVQELKVEGSSGAGGGKMSVLYDAYFPEGVRGYRILDENGAAARASTISRQGGHVQIHFNARPGETLRLEALGEPARNTPAIHRNGLLRSVRPYTGEAVNSLGEFEARWRAGGTERLSVEKMVFSGMNPLWPERRTLTMFSGFIKVPENGLYVFVTASSDASFLIIDDQLVAAAPGRHDVYSCRHGERRGAIRLSKGEHRFRYCHANNRDDYFVIAALVVSEKRMEVLQPSAFTPFLAAEGKTISGQGSLTWKHTATIEVDGMQLREVTLGDGRRLFFYDDSIMQRLEGYAVVCPVDAAPQPLPPARQSALVEAACAAAADNPPGPAGFQFLAAALAVYGLEQPAINFLRQHAGNPRLEEVDALRLARRILDDRLGSAERYDEAAEVWRALEQARGGRFTLEYARLLLECLDRPDAAAEVLATMAAPEELPPQVLRQRRILEAEVLLRRQGYAAAAAAYDEMPPRGDVAAAEVEDDDLPPGLPATASAALAAMAQCYSKNNPAEAWTHLRNLENLNPRSRLDPRVSAMKYRLAALLKRPRLATNLAARLLLLQPPPAIAAEALLYLAKSAAARGDAARARELRRRILEEYPATAAALEAEALKLEPR